MLKPYLEIGKAVGTHGLRGEVRVEAWCDSPDELKGIKRLFFDERGSFSVEVEAIRPHGRLVLIKFKGIDTIEVAEALRGKLLFAAREALRLAEGRSFIQDIIDCEAVDADTGASLGRITDVITGIANDVWCVSSNGREYLVPAIDGVVVEKRLEEGIVILRPLKGIFDDEN